MHDQDAQELTDEGVMNRLDEAYLAHTLEHDPKWKVVLTWLRKERDMAQKKIATTDPTKFAEIVRQQETIRICNHIAEKIFEGVKKDGENALLEAQDRGLIPVSDPSNAS